jgi:cytochrome P450
MIFTNISITGSIVVFMLTQLAKHPEFQQKLHEEIVNNKEKAGPKLEAYITSSTTLLHYLCMEIIRLHPALGKSRLVLPPQLPISTFH